jgi:2-oxoglutarate dehydrogenase complex dehydrogenase (E1) component-like enzyme
MELEGGQEHGTTLVTKAVWSNLMKRWLQSNSERRHNVVVVSPSTPAQYFHCLRRQIHRYEHWLFPPVAVRCR